MLRPCNSRLETSLEGDVGEVMLSFVYSWETSNVRCCSRRCLKQFERNCPLMQCPEFCYVESKRKPKLHSSCSSLVEVEHLNRSSPLRAWRVNGSQAQWLRQFDPALARRLFCDRHFVRALVEKDGKLLQFADATLQKDKELVLAAVQQTGRALNYADATLRNDPDVVRKAIENNGNALFYAGDHFQRDRDTVLAAAQKDGGALAYADASFRSDRDVILKAVTSNGIALQYADLALTKDKAIVKTAIRQNKAALRYAHSSLKNDTEFIDDCLSSSLLLEGRW